MQCLKKPMTRSRQIRAIRSALADLVNDTTITARARLRALELLETEICGFISDLQAPLPEPATKLDVGGGSARM